jgi:hypothetical protein
MIEELANLLDNFPGAANQTRCFTHILNLVVKSILAQFELPKGKAHISDEILKLAEELELEDEISAKEGEGGEENDDDNVEGWIDEREEMSEDQLEVLEARVEPIRLLLIKVCCDECDHVMTLMPAGAFSFASRPSLSRTRPLLSFQSGSSSSMTSNSTLA